MIQNPNSREHLLRWTRPSYIQRTRTFKYQVSHLHSQTFAVCQKEKRADLLGKTSSDWISDSTVQALCVTRMFLMIFTVREKNKCLTGGQKNRTREQRSRFDS